MKKFFLENSPHRTVGERGWCSADESNKLSEPRSICMNCIAPRINPDYIYKVFFCQMTVTANGFTEAQLGEEIHHKHPKQIDQTL
jgi:hypothetical protein